jgi:hypothetical protein
MARQTSWSIRRPFALWVDETGLPHQPPTQSQSSGGSEEWVVISSGGGGSFIDPEDPIPPGVVRLSPSVLLLDSGLLGLLGWRRFGKHYPSILNHKLMEGQPLRPCFFCFQCQVRESPRTDRPGRAGKLLQLWELQVFRPDMKFTGLRGVEAWGAHNQSCSQGHYGGISRLQPAWPCFQKFLPCPTYCSKKGTVVQDA